MHSKKPQGQILDEHTVGHESKHNHLACAWSGEIWGPKTTWQRFVFSTRIFSHILREKNLPRRRSITLPVESSRVEWIWSERASERKSNTCQTITSSNCSLDPHVYGPPDETYRTAHCKPSHRWPILSLLLWWDVSGKKVLGQGRVAVVRGEVLLKIPSLLWMTFWNLQRRRLWELGDCC